MTNQTANRDYKDSLFRLIFGSEENKEFTLSLYNAINGSHYTDASQLRLNTLQRVVFLGMRNDVSFVFDSSLQLYEHQSSYSPNMPLRGFFYLADVLRKELRLDGENRMLYSAKLLCLPTPQVVVFYNGEQFKEDQFELHLKDAFEAPEKACVDLVVKVLNINSDHNQGLMANCLALRQYAAFVSETRRLVAEGKTSEEAIFEAMETIISEEAGLSAFFREHRAEVTEVYLDEYDEEGVRQLMREEAFEQGLEQGKATFIQALKNKGMSAQEIAELGNMSVEAVEKILSE